MNDCSTDGSVALVEEFFKKSSWLYKLVNFSENQGLCVGRCYVEENAIAVEALYNAVFYLHRGNVVMCAWLVMKSVCYRPSYLFDKIKNNLIG